MESNRKFLRISVEELKEKFRDKIGEGVEIVGFFKMDDQLVVTLEKVGSAPIERCLMCGHPRGKESIIKKDARVDV